MTADDPTGMSTNGQEATASPEEDIAVVRAGIEQTRAEMSETIDAIEEKLSPSRIKQQAKETVKQATVGRASEAIHAVSETYTEKANAVSQRARTTALPLVAIGLSAAVIVVAAYLMKQRRERARQTWQE